MKKYKFEFIEEIVVFVKNNNNEECLADIDKEEYFEQYKIGATLFDQGDYIKAIEEYEKCFLINPIGINARFEIAECYIALGKLQEANNYLRSFFWMLLRKEDVARWYRRVGFIQTESTEYKTAAACFMYSQIFEKAKSASMEIIYLISTAHIDINAMDVERQLIKVGIPLFHVESDMPKEYQ